MRPTCDEFVQLLAVSTSNCTGDSDRSRGLPILVDAVSAYIFHGIA